MSQRNRLFVLLLAVTIPMFALAAIFVLTSVREARLSAERDAQSLAAAAALATESFFEGHVNTLSAISLSVRDAPSVSEAETRARLTEVYGLHAEWDGLSVVDGRGIIIAGSRATSAGVDLSEREYLQRLFATGQPVVSSGLVTLVEQRPAVVIGVPVTFTDGARGALVGSVSLANLSRSLIEELAPPGVRIGLIDHLGQTLVHPDPERVSSLMPVGGRPDVAAALRGERGTLEAPREGVSTLVAYESVAELGWAGLSLSPNRRLPPTLPRSTSRSGAGCSSSPPRSAWSRADGSSAAGSTARTSRSRRRGRRRQRRANARRRRCAAGTSSSRSPRTNSATR